MEEEAASARYEEECDFKDSVSGGTPGKGS